MVKDWLDCFGEEFTEGLLKANNEVAPFTVKKYLKKSWWIF